MTYEFTIASPMLVVSNVKNSSDGTLNIPTVYMIGVSNLIVANTIGPRNSIYISDFSGVLDSGGAAIKVRAWDVSGAEIPESESLSSYKIFNYETVKIYGSELASRFSSGSPIAYEFTVDSSKVVITNVKSSSDGSINIPTVYTRGITKYTTNYVSNICLRLSESVRRNNRKHYFHDCQIFGIIGPFWRSCSFKSVLIIFYGGYKLQVATICAFRWFPSPTWEPAE